MSREEAADGSSEADESIDTEFIVVGQKCRNNKDLAAALDSYGFPVRYSDTGFEHMNDADYDTIFIVDNFDGDIYNRLHKEGCRILGPPVIIRCSQNNERLPNNKRPVYSLTMCKLVLCFTGFKFKDELTRLALLVHHMGGSVRRDLNASVTHLIANCTSGEKYRTAVSLDIPIMGRDWVYQCWEHREDTTAKAVDSIFIGANKLSPFAFTILSFYGFTPSETKHMTEVAERNGALVAEPGAPNCTHLVVDEHNVRQIPFKTVSKLNIVRSAWFWASIQVEARTDESFYIYEEITDTPENGLNGKKTTPGSKTRKRKRDLKEKMAQLASEGQVLTPMYKRSSTEMLKISFNNGSFLDATVDTSAGTPLSEVAQRDGHQPTSPAPTPTTSHPKETAVKLSARHERVRELFHTEKNYVGILHTILKVFKEGVEKPDQHGGPILDVQEIRTIFGGIPPIYDVHLKIRDNLLEILSDWKEDCLVGNVILNHVDDLCKAYPNFVNYFEQAKAKIQHCDRTKQRFHAFLKVCQSRSECGRQGLTDLLIRPIQRLPSIMLLLKDIMKKTDPSNPDYTKLELAISKLDEVTRHINEDRRIAEGHVAMFDIVHDIEDCPPNLLSAHRSFINKVDCVDLSDGAGGKGNSVTLFIFSDSLELCKRRVRVLSSRSPGVMHTPRTPQKAYKHLDILQFSEIKRVVNIAESADCRNVFALIAKKPDDKAETMYAFALVEDSVNKVEFLTSLSKSICANLCRTDYETLLTTVAASVLHIDTSDLSNRSISRAASKFGKRVSRVFSFTKTPRRLKRTISSMTQIMSPFRRESGIAVTPSRSDLRQMRLASTNDLTQDENYFDGHLEKFDEKYDGNMTYSELVDKMSIGTITPVMRRREMSANESPMSGMSRTPSTMSMDSRFLLSMGSTMSLNIQ